MRVKVSFTVEVDDRIRRAIAHDYDCGGESDEPSIRLATRAEVQEWFRGHGWPTDILTETHYRCCGWAQPTEVE
jgi:hypothetical protein